MRPILPGSTLCARRNNVSNHPGTVNPATVTAATQLGELVVARLSAQNKDINKDINPLQGIDIVEAGGKVKTETFDNALELSIEALKTHAELNDQELEKRGYIGQHADNATVQPPPDLLPSSNQNT